jgi:ribonuclease D
MTVMMITTTEKLTEVCGRFAQLPFITLDTEFIREKTYWPVLCLIQIASKDEAYCIDPLADGIDLSPLFDLMQNENVVKVFHAARQDLEIFYHLTGQIPMPLFDTQVAAMVCGFGESVSYQQLVQELTNTAIDKSMRYTDWSKRPLTESQVSYALHDVTHLINVYEKLKDKLAQNNRGEWLSEEMSVLTSPHTYDIGDDTAWTKVRCHLTNGRQMHVFAKICAWREKTAKLKNRPRRHIMKDDMVQELAVAHPISAEQMDLMRSLPKGFSKSALGVELIDVIATAMTEEVQKYEVPEKRKGLTNSQKNIGELVRLLLSVVSDDLGVAPKIIAGTDDIVDVIVGRAGSKVMSGWRYDVFGRYVEALKAGKLSFCYDTKRRKVKITELA